MKDAVFKALKHPVGACTIASAGSSVSPGYKPDITVRDSAGILRFILECEQKTDRKAFLGDLLKAEVYAEQQNARPELVIVMQVFKNTTTLQIADHLRLYKRWLNSKKAGHLNLSAIHVLSDNEYLAAIAAGECIGFPAIKRRGHVL